MKKKLAFFVSVTILSVVAILASVATMNASDRFLNANIDALMLLESGAECTGPKKENLAGNIFCHSENTAPCQDMYGCD